VVRAFGSGSAPKIYYEATKFFVALVRFVVKHRSATDRHLGLHLRPITLNAPPAHSITAGLQAGSSVG